MRSSRLSNSSGPGSRLVTTSTNGAPALTRTSSGWKRFASMTSTTSDCGSAAKTTPGAAARALNASAAARAPITTSLGPTHGPRRLGVPNYERTVNFSLGEPLGLPEMPAAPSGSRRRSLDGELWREGGGEAGRRPCTLTGRGVDHVRLRAAARRDRAGARSRPRRRAAPRDRSRPGGRRLGGALAGPAGGLGGPRGPPPLPPYIERFATPTADDRERYQTVYARPPGSVAAPTAGLHFTHALLDRLRARGVELHEVTLHVGPGTFRPIKTATVEDHRLPPERVSIPQAVADAVNRARVEGRRVLAVGTTTTRALESAAQADGRVRPVGGDADVYITPGYRFRVVDALLTNFHLPRSSLLVLVAAFAGRELILKAYAHAVRAGYRFYSYGDACLLL